MRSHPSHIHGVGPGTHFRETRDPVITPAGNNAWRRCQGPAAFARKAPITIPSRRRVRCMRQKNEAASIDLREGPRFRHWCRDTFGPKWRPADDTFVPAFDYRDDGRHQCRHSRQCADRGTFLVLEAPKGRPHLRIHDLSTVHGDGERHGWLLLPEPRLGRTAISRVLNFSAPLVLWLLRAFAEIEDATALRAVVAMAGALRSEGVRRRPSGLWTAVDRHFRLRLFPEPLTTRHSSSALRPASVILTRATVILRPPVLNVWRCAVASPSLTKSANMSTLKPRASSVAPVQPSGPASASISSARRCSPPR